MTEVFVDQVDAGFQRSVEGTWGEFITPAGNVSYLLTKARLGTTGTDRERRLTSQLVPVRELFSVADMDFSQILQRDLDDHRVATQLVPYLLTPKATGPAFFPPIVAALLPFEANQPAKFPEGADLGISTDQGVTFREMRYGDAFQVQRHARATGEVHPIKLGRIAWNDELARLVVLDGQHRSMALLAIDRTINGTWDQGSGTRYRHFYEHRIKEILRSEKVDLDSIEVPVAVCWFPELVGPASDPHKAVRKLFVDVNKEARQPSEARLVLLSDTELVNIFTRAILNELKGNPSAGLPLFAVEYDNPHAELSRSARWSVVTNLNLLRLGTLRCVFGPKKYLDDMTARFGGRDSLEQMDAFMRHQLNIKAIFPSVFTADDRTWEADSIGNEHFPMSKIEELSTRFMESWGTAFVRILGETLPYAAHCDALRDLNADWVTDDAIASLAHEAIFQGVGVYWTLRDSDSHYREEVGRGGPPPTKPDIVKAWEIVQSKASNFGVHRAHRYLGKSNDEARSLCDTAFAIMNTNACQLGAMLAFGSIATKASVPVDDIATLSETVVSAWNNSLATSIGNQLKHSRRLIFSRTGISDPLNRIRNMDTPRAVFFRYFWLELLTLPEAADVLATSSFDLGSAVRLLISDARRDYLSYLAGEQVKAIRVTHPEWEIKRAQKEALQIETHALAKSLKRWFAVSDEEFATWHTSAQPPEPVAEDQVDADEPADLEEEASEPASSVEELLEQMEGEA